MRLSNLFYHFFHPFTLRSGQTLSEREKKMTRLALFLTPIGFYIVADHFKRKLKARVLAESSTMAHLRNQISIKDSSESDSLYLESSIDELEEDENLSAMKVALSKEEETIDESDHCSLKASFLVPTEQEEFLTLPTHEKLEVFLACDGPPLGDKLRELLEHHESLFFEFFRETLLSKNQVLVEEFLAKITLSKLVSFTGKPHFFSAVVSYIYPGLDVEDLDLSSSHLLLLKRSLYMLLGKLQCSIASRDLDGFGTLISELTKRKIGGADQLKALCAHGVLENKDLDAEKSFEILARYGWLEILETQQGRDGFFDKLFGVNKNRYLSFFEKDALLSSMISDMDLIEDQADIAHLDWSLCLRYIKLFHHELLVESICAALDSDYPLDAFVPALDQALVLEVFKKKYDHILIINGVQFPINAKFLRAFQEWNILFLGGKRASQSSLPFDESSLRLIVSFLAVQTNRDLDDHQLEWQKLTVKDFEALLTYDKLSFFKHTDLFPVAYSFNLILLLAQLLDHNKIEKSEWFVKKFNENRGAYIKYINTYDPNLVLESFQALEDIFVNHTEFPKEVFYRLMILTNRYKYYQVMMALSKEDVHVFQSMYQCLSLDSCDEFFELYSDFSLTFQNETVKTNKAFLSALFSYFDINLRSPYSEFQISQLDCSQLPISWDTLKSIHQFAKKNQFPKITDGNIGEILEALHYLNPDLNFEYLNGTNWTAKLKKSCEDWLLAHRRQFSFYQYLEWVCQDRGYGFRRAANLLDIEVVKKFSDQTLEFFAKNGSFAHGIHEQADKLLGGDLKKHQLIRLYFKLIGQAASEDIRKFWRFLIASEPDRCKLILEEYFKNSNYPGALRLLQEMDSKDALGVLTSGKYILSFKDRSSSFLIPVSQLKKIFPDRLEDSIEDVLSSVKEETFLNLIELHLFKNKDVLEDSNVFQLYDLAKILGLSDVKRYTVDFMEGRLNEIIRWRDGQVFFYRSELVARPRLLADELKKIDKLIIDGRFRLKEGNLPMLHFDRDDLLVQRAHFTALDSLTININMDQSLILKEIAPYASDKEIHLKIDDWTSSQELKEYLKEIPKNWNIASIRLISQQEILGQVDRAVLDQLKKFSSLKQVVFVNASIDPHLDLTFDNIPSLIFERTEASRIQLLSLSPSVKSLHFVETFLNDEDVKELCEKLSLEEMTLMLHQGLQARHVRRLKKEFPNIKFNCE
ncbi:MAG: hypothetical protein ACSNEK_00880 [Parachlamydiaceae bacterium]